MRLLETVERLAAEHADLLAEIERGAAKPIDLSSLKISEWLPSFRRNPESAAAESRVEVWARSFGIWLDRHGPNTVTMAAYLHPETQSVEALDALEKFYQILWFVDDTIGSEFRKEMTAEQALASDQTTLELSDLMSDDRRTPHAKTGVVAAAADFLRDLRRLADPAWTNEFLASLRDHLARSTHDQNAAFDAGSFAVDAYARARNEVSAMTSTVMMAEFATGEYLRRATLPPAARDAMRRAEDACASIGSLANDLFSFEKEVVDRRDGFNLVALLAASEGLGLAEAVDRARSVTNDAFGEFVAARRDFLDALASDDPARLHVQHLDAVVAACWRWQLETGRYERPRSIFAQVDAAWRRANAADADLEPKTTAKTRT